MTPSLDDPLGFLPPRTSRIVHELLRLIVSLEEPERLALSRLLRVRRGPNATRRCSTCGRAGHDRRTCGEKT